MLTTRSKNQAGVTAPPTTKASSTAAPTAEPLSIPQRVRRYLPSGQTLSAEAFANRHKVLQWLLTTHLPALALLFYGLGYALSHTVLELVPVALALALSTVGSRRTRSLVVTAGLLWSSILLVHATDGRIEAHFHFFVMLAFVAGTFLSHGVGSLLNPQSIFNHAAGQNNPWVWSLLHGAAVLLESVGLLIFTSNVEQEVPLAEVLRGAVAEIEDFVRVDITVPPQVQVDGRVVADLVHLFAELLENATTFSPPSARVEVTCRRSPTGRLWPYATGGSACPTTS